MITIAWSLFMLVDVCYRNLLLVECNIQRFTQKDMLFQTLLYAISKSTTCKLGFFSNAKVILFLTGKYDE